MTDFNAVRIPIYWAGIPKDGIFVCGACPDPAACKQATVCQRATPEAWAHDAQMRDEAGRKALDDD